MNDAPAARQSRGTARPQAGESTFPRQTSIRKDGRFCFAGPHRRTKRRNNKNLVNNVRISQEYLCVKI